MYLPYSGWNTGGMMLRGRKVGGKGGNVVTSATGGVEMKNDERLRQGSNSRGSFVIRQGLQFGENGGLAEREHGIFGVWVELHYHILDLQRAGMSGHGGETSKWPWWNTSSPQRSSSPCRSFRRSQVFTN